jgi:hypothetical protein
MHVKGADPGATVPASGNGVTGGFPSRLWNGARMTWTYLALAAGVLVLLNVLIVVVLLVTSRVHRSEHDDDL